MKRDILEITKKDILDAIEAGAVTPLYTGKDTFVFRHNGLKFSARFDADNKCVSWDCDSPSDHYKDFLKLFGDKYTFSYVRLLDGGIPEDDKYLLYVKPKVVLPWMLRTHGGEGDHAWCIGRYFPVRGGMNNLMIDVTHVEDHPEGVEVNWFCRVFGYDTYYPMASREEMYAYDPALNIDSNSDLPC